jgi:hypothetical protein
MSTGHNTTDLWPEKGLEINLTHHLEGSTKKNSISFRLMYK